VDDSREAAPGTAFFARHGSKADGVAFHARRRAAGRRSSSRARSSPPSVPTLVCRTWTPRCAGGRRRGTAGQDVLDLVGVTGTKARPPRRTSSAPRWPPRGDGAP
jgi:UDP-N-acetylmuramyl tripeptide synthase